MGPEQSNVIPGPANRTGSIQASGHNGQGHCVKQSPSLVESDQVDRSNGDQSSQSAECDRKGIYVCHIPPCPAGWSDRRIKTDWTEDEIEDTDGNPYSKCAAEQGPSSHMQHKARSADRRPGKIEFVAPLCLHETRCGGTCNRHGHAYA